MKRVLLIALGLSFTAGPAAADELLLPGRHHEGRAFWLNNQAWPNPRTESGAKLDAPKFTKTYMDGVASRFGAGSAHMDFFDRKLGGSGPFSPQLAGTVDGGGAKFVLRWHPGE